MNFKKEKFLFFVLISSALLLGGISFLIIGKNFLFAEWGNGTKSSNTKIQNIEDYDISEFFYYKQEGKSSWYGKRFHKRKTASGEIFDMNKFSAAHRFLPFGTIARVKNTENDKVILVKINDRGPFVFSKIIDLSYYSAEVLGSLGNSNVVIEALIPQEKTEIELSEPYFFGISYEYPLVCLPQSKIEIIKEFNSFDEAISYYDFIQNNLDNFYYIFVPINQTYKNIYNYSERYFIGRYQNRLVEKNPFYVEKDKSK
ncbi:MAG: septal ring lytic transglycosylase RlpA family protein [Ignavibacteria bacterium]|nr:septal ring lytic transglycosylase RlpA family protein [Ignavibacteria bacterium]